MKDKGTERNKNKKKKRNKKLYLPCSDKTLNIYIYKR